MLATLLISSMLAVQPIRSSFALVATDDRKPEDIRVGNDDKKRYLLHAPPKEAKEAASGWRVLVVLPGGDGSAEFAPFLGHVRDEALGDGWLLAQIVAPVWDEDQAKSIVWPTDKNRWKGMKFSTEKLVDLVVEDLAKRKHVDPKSIFTLSWSSGGPAAYAISLEPKTRIAGSFVAMSVFRPEWLPSLKTASGRFYYLYHSPQDTTVPMSMAEKARDELTKQGAVVELATYDGGHGWHGNVFDDIKHGVAWLQEQSATKALKPKTAK
jgi:predicted esterase